MDGTLFLIILTIICQNIIISQQNDRLIFDLTRPLNELIDGNITAKDFISDLHLAFGLVGANSATSTILYSTVGGTFEELQERINVVQKIINETLETSSNTELLISWTINNTKWEEIDIDYSYNEAPDGCKLYLLLNLRDKKDCNALIGYYNGIRDIFDDWFWDKDEFVPIIFDESLIECRNIEYITDSHIDTFGVSFKFGESTGVTESFGLFQTRMKFLSEKIDRYFFSNRKKRIIFFPHPEAVGNENHRNLLLKYASLWKPTEQTQEYIVVQIPKSTSEATSTRFSIVPKFSIFERPLRTGDEEFLWSFVMLAASFQRQQSFIIGEDAWELWNRRLENVSQALKIHKLAVSIDMILVCGGGDCRALIDPSNPPSLSVRQVSRSSKIGCKFNRGWYSFRSKSDIADVVRGCQIINGNLYTLGITSSPEWDQDRERYSFNFENTVRPQLHAINQLRQRILEVDPSANVYLKYEMIEIRPSRLHRPISESGFLFCDEFGPTVNLYFEGIFNWAKLENFPIIVDIVSERPMGSFRSWYKLLRRLNYPYSDWSAQDRKMKPGQLGTISSPAFLMQEYFKSIHNWEQDRCIDWTEKRWEFADDFFHNADIGVAFDPQSTFDKQTITVDEFSLMLQFLSYRFRLVEFVIGHSFQNLLSAIERNMESEYTDFNTQMWMCFNMTGQDPQRQSQLFQTILAQLEKNNIHKSGLLKGIHVELGVTCVEENCIFNHESVSRMMMYAKQSNVSLGIQLPSVKLFYEILKRFTFDSAYLGLLSTVKYFVCKESLITNTSGDHRQKLETVLESHLILKRTLSALLPFVKVYFRVEFDFKVSRNETTLDKYTNNLVLFKTFGAAYDIGYIVGDAFDSQLERGKYGWWGIRNYSDLTNPQSYIEKVTAYRCRQMWYPIPIPPPKIAVPAGQPTLVIVGLCISSAIVLLLLILGVVFGLRYRKLHHLSKFLSSSEVEEFIKGRVSANSEPGSMQMELVENVEHAKFNHEFRLDLSDLTIDLENVLGAGTFGTVYKGIAKDRPAAIKRPNADCSKSTFKSILTEVKVLSYIGKHLNVVEFVGAYVEEIHKGVLYISTELCSRGSLETFLRTKSIVKSRVASQQYANIELEGSELSLHQLNTFAMEIAEGMEYIESRRVVHGDLATRNVLLDENLVCKIGDFGLSRKLYEYQKYVKTSQEPLPWKWMAPESLTKMEFTSKSDMWSFGVTIWEIYSLGKIPYAGLNWTVDFTKDLQNGLRLTIPDFSPENIFSKMLDCWMLNPEERPTFAELANFFKSVGESAYTVLDSGE